MQQNLKINKEYMPEICRFYGIVIYLYWMDIPAKVVSKVNQWMDIHQDEIMKLWEKASKGEKIEKIEPLK